MLSEVEASLPQEEMNYFPGSDASAALITTFFIN